MAKGSETRNGARGQAPVPARNRSLDRPKAWALSPSDFAFLWDECPRCFYKKLVLNQGRPRTPFPKVFTLIDRAMKDLCLGERAEELAVGAPTGVIGSPDRWVKSEALSLPGCHSSLVIRGRLDGLVACDDDTVGVIDFKTAEPNGNHIATYSRQLHAYALALEHPSAGHPESVSSLGLLCFLPDEFEAAERRAALLGDLQWIEVPRDDASMYAFLSEVVSVLERPKSPAPAPDCAWCSRDALSHISARCQL
jgi:hypothetical protein